MLPENLLILNYHKIEDKSDIGITARRPRDFLDDLDELQNCGYQTITFSDLFLKNRIPEKPVIISFDDGYTSFYWQALPALKKKNMTAVVFVPAAYIGQENIWDVRIFGKNFQHMNEDMLSEISNSGIEIGSHSLTHKNLPGLSRTEIETELSESKNILEQITGKNILTFSYPFGKFNSVVLSLVKKYYRFGVQLTQVPARLNGTAQYLLPRINIYRTDSRKVFTKKLDYFNYPALIYKNQLIQKGAWATILLQKIRNINKLYL